MNKSGLIKVLAVAVVVIIIGAAIFVMLGGEEEDQGDGPALYYDMAGRNVTAVVEMEIDHLVASGVGALRFVSYLNCSDKVVAVEAREGPAYNAKSYMYAFEYDNKSNFNRSIGSGADGLIEYPEQLLMLQDTPQVIIYSVPSRTLTAEQQNYISNAELLGMKVVVILELDTMLNEASDGLSEVFVNQTMLMGNVLNKTAKASELLSFMNDTISDLRSRMSTVSAADREVSAYIGCLSYAGAKGFDYSSSWYDPFALLGVNNTITGGSSVVYQINMESIIEMQPEYVFLEPTGYKTFLADWNNGSSARSSSVLNAMTAFQEGNVFMTVPFIWYGVNFDNVLLGAYYIGSVLYPDAFDDVVLEDKAAEIFGAFVGYDCYAEMDAWFLGNRSTNITGQAGVVSG